MKPIRKKVISGRPEKKLQYGSNVISRDLKKVLADFIYNEVTRTGLGKVVIGLSGGIDSTVSAYLARQALGKNNVIGVMMPYKTSSPDSLKDAMLVSKNLGIKSVIINITGAVDALLENFPEAQNDKIRKANIIARMRMICLYDQSAKFSALVLGTSNKTEILLGYTTLYGDSASALNPIGDLYKTQVWQLARSIGCPENIIRKKPSADLWKGQTDEGELGFTYKEVDRLLYYMIDQRYSEKELMDEGFDKHFISKVKKLIQKNQFKRIPPPIAKISNRTVNIDFRYNRDWGT